MYNFKFVLSQEIIFSPTEMFRFAFDFLCLSCIILSFSRPKDNLRNTRNIVLSRSHVSFCHAGTNHAGTAVDSVRMHGADRGVAVSLLPGNVGNETSGHGVGGGEYRQSAAGIAGFAVLKAAGCTRGAL